MIDPKKAACADARATLAGLPSAEFAAYMSTVVFFFGALYCAALKLGGVHEWALPSLGITNAQLLGAMISVGPVAVGIAMLLNSTPNAMANLKRTLVYPFHKEKLFGAFGLNLALGVLVTAVPCYHTVTMLLSPPGQAVYCQLWGCS